MQPRGPPPGAEEWKEARLKTAKGWRVGGKQQQKGTKGMEDGKPQRANGGQEHGEARERGKTPRNKELKIVSNGSRGEPKQNREEEKRRRKRKKRKGQGGTKKSTVKKTTRGCTSGQKQNEEEKNEVHEWPKARRGGEQRQ